MILAILFGLLLGREGSEFVFKTIEKRIERVIEDKDRQTQAAAILEKIEAQSEGFYDQLETSIAELEIIHLDHKASSDDYVATIERLETARTRTNRQLIAYRSQLTKTMTADEWRRIFK